MKSSIFAGLAGLSALASAAPADNIRRANDLGHQVQAPDNDPQAYGTGLPYPIGTGVPFRPIPYPTGASPSYTYPPMPTGSSTCPIDGAVVCNGPKLFGLCNFGHVVWQQVADGTACQDGKIVGTGIYAVPGPTAVPSAYKT